MTETLQFTPGDAQWTAYRERGLKDFYWFNGVVLNHGDLIPMTEQAHYLLCRFIARQTGIPRIDHAPFRKIEMPRDTGKSTLGTRGYSLWRIVKDRIEHNRDIAILIANEKADIAEAFLKEISGHFEYNELFRSLYPEVIPPNFQTAPTWASAKIEVPRLRQGRSDPTIATTGVGGGRTGTHPDLIIVDDMISREAMENARSGSWQIMHQTNRWIHQLRPILNSNAVPYPEIMFIGTRWWHGDCYEHLEEHFGYGERPQTFRLRYKLPDSNVQSVEVFRVGDLAVFRRAAIENGRSIFPEKWNLDDLAKIRLGDEALFACNYMNAPSNEQTATFKESWLQYYDWLDDRQVQWTDGQGGKHIQPIDALDVMVLVDPGGFSVRGTEDRARAAIVVTGLTAENDILILETYSEKDTYLVALQQVVAMAGRYGARKVAVEQAAQQLQFIDQLRGQVLASVPNCQVEMVKPGGKAKAQRILGLETYFQRGKVYIGKGAGFHEFRTQYSQFPRTARVDLLDALAYGPHVWPRLLRKTLPNEARKRAELTAYYQKRGLDPSSILGVTPQ